MQPEPVKILATVPSGFCFGLQHITVDLFSRFPSDIRSHFLLTRWTNGEMGKLLQKNNIPYSFSWLGMFSRKMDWINIRMSLHALIKLPQLYIDFIRLNKKTSPDILYFANHHELILLYPVLLFTRKKVVCHMHDPSPAIPFQKMTFKRYDKLVDGYIAISENVRHRTIDLGCNPEKITTIYNGIQISAHISDLRENKFSTEAGWDTDVFIIGITGQMTEKKGHMDLLDAFYKVYKRNPLARLVIGGKKEEPLYKMICDKIREWQIEHLVYFPGWLDDVQQFFRNIDLFVLASRHDEGYGLVIAEAMSCGLPVVITESGGAVEIVQDGETGYIVSKQSVEAMSARIYELSSDRILCRSMGMKGRGRVKEFFNIDQQAKHVADYMQKIKKNVR